MKFIGNYFCFSYEEYVFNFRTPEVFQWLKKKEVREKIVWLPVECFGGNIIGARG